MRYKRQKLFITSYLSDKMRLKKKQCFTILSIGYVDLT